MRNTFGLLLLLLMSEFDCRADRGAVLHAAVGKVDFPVEHLHANLGALTAAILAARPKGIKGGGESCAMLPVLVYLSHI